jgi:MerR family transcriptional regulator, light-induced transcriptional regulator
MVAVALTELREQYVAALVDADLAAARALVEDAAAVGTPVRDLYLDVLQPALYEIGRRWEEAEISVAQEHLATATTETLMARLSERLGAPGAARREGTAIVACVDGELHAVGGRMVADFLAADGWRVLFVGALTPPEELAALARRDGALVVALSAALSARLDRVREAVAALRALEPAPFVLAGGQAFEGDGARAIATGADAYAAGPLEAVALLAERFRVAA